ncbi:MAG: hypothetical protein QMC67_03535 [Candidatus Wallbacteria bacterium]
MSLLDDLKEETRQDGLKMEAERKRIHNLFNKPAVPVKSVIPELKSSVRMVNYGSYGKEVITVLYESRYESRVLDSNGNEIDGIFSPMSDNYII